MHQPSSTSSQSKPTTTLFLTGGSGYLGRNLIRHFTAQGFGVVALVRSDKAAETVRALGAEPYQGDLLGTQLVQGMKDCRFMIHAAADTNHGYGTAQQRQTNLDGTRNLFNAARQAGVARAVHVSSESVLLDGKPLINATEGHPFPVKPAGTYSATKAEAERMALSMSMPGFEVVVVRPRFIWGRDDTTALPFLVDAVKSGQFAWIDGGHYRTSTTHVANACEGIALALEKGRGGEVYFLADETPVEFRQFVSRMLETQGLPMPEKGVPRWLVRSMARVGDRLAQLSRGRLKMPLTRQEFATSAVEVTLDISKARTELGYRPVVTLEEGLAELKAMNE